MTCCLAYVFFCGGRSWLPARFFMSICGLVLCYPRYVLAFHSLVSLCFLSLLGILHSHVFLFLVGTVGGSLLFAAAGGQCIRTCRRIKTISHEISVADSFL